MTGKKMNSAGPWWMKLAVVWIFVFAFCLAMPALSVHAEEAGPDIVKQQDKTSQNFGDPNSSNADAEQIKVAPTLTITLQDEDGLPISGVSLSAVAADFTARSKGSATTDKNGKAVFTHLTSGTYYFFANFNAIRSHAGYGIQAMVRQFKSSRTFYISESRKFDLSANAESTYTVKRGAYMYFETYLQTVRSGKIIVLNEKNGIEQTIPVASTDYLQIYLPMRTLYKIITIKDNDFDSWIMEFYAHERLRIELL